jgi:hypothetical protein
MYSYTKIYYPSTPAVMQNKDHLAIAYVEERDEKLRIYMRFHILALVIKISERYY